MSGRPPAIVKEDGLWLEWFSRRSELECNVYILNPDGTRGRLVSPLGYPKVSGIGFSDFTPEAKAIAKQELADYPNCKGHDGPHADACGPKKVK